MTADRPPCRPLPPWWRTLSTQALLTEYSNRLTAFAVARKDLADRPKRLMERPAIDSDTALLRVIAMLLGMDLELIHAELKRRHGDGIAGMIHDHYETESHRAVPGQPIDVASTARPTAATAIEADSQRRS